MGVDGPGEGGVLGRGTHRELVHIGASQEDGPSFPKLAGDRSIVGGGVSACEKFGATGARLTQGIDVIFEDDGNAAKRLG